MNRIVTTFDRPRVLLPVIHPISRQSAIQNAHIAIEEGAAGVFITDQGGSEEDVLAIVEAIRFLYPKLWVGVNLLTRSADESLAIALARCQGRIDGIWSDDAGIYEHQTDQPTAHAMVAKRVKLDWLGLYFGGVAFKYQREVAPKDLRRATKIAAHYMDVICTSGTGTGIAANPAKLCVMREATTTPIALASGVTIKNVGDYLPYVDAFLVGTGLEQEFGVFDRYKVRDLAQAVHA